ncbi:PQQ-dependent sugar dehydrogenase [Fulvivirgaceae bacterium BMA12]|uniref:PQQ-dependent sugar dehydrogenase n=1 Tax=Agaribacillus aureus TaxID=3051825 RepID=A0ABT8L193_9BACT|nr:PQQ-dependent sugar dehydrogenase [Fulvivirgaceae bacterium BMA12]
MRILTLLLSIGFMQCHEIRLPPGDPDNGGLFFPEGFEAVVVADSLGLARHLAVNDNGDIYVKLRMSNPEGENVAMRDTDNDGKADIIKRFGVYENKHRYGNGMRIHQGYLYFSTAGEVYRNKLTPGKLVPESKTEVILRDDYKNAKYGYSHIAKPLAFDNEGNMYVPFGAPGDVCQVADRRPGSPGQDPCPELENHGGIWRFDANREGQTQKDGYRYATGIRSVVGMDWNHVDNTLYALQHGRDNMASTWPDLYTPWQSAMLPSEEFLRVKDGTDAGWPYYYYDQMQEKKLLNPEYGGDGKKAGNGHEYEQPIIGFPGHWAPNDLLFYEGDQFPEHYKNGAFIAFHGSTIRAPYPQSGYFIGFVPFKNGAPSGPWEVFADGFAQVDTIINTSNASYRPMGLAVGPDGSLYISESEHGKIWRVMYKGNKKDFGPAQLAGMEQRKSLPHIRTPHEINDNMDKVVAKAGQKVYNFYCGSCHQRDGKGDGNRFPPLNGSEWVTDDKWRLLEITLKGMEGPITVKGQPYDGIMPPHNHLTDEELSQVLTYVRKSFGNDASRVTTREVRWVRRRLKME